MSFWAIILLSLGMSADAFAAALARGAAHQPPFAMALRTGLLFGVVEGATPILGWLAGRAAARQFESVGHWLAFALLLGVGLHMLREARRPADAPDTPDAAAGRPRRRLWVLILTAIGTSIDAGAVGFGLAFINVPIWQVAAAIAVSTFALATAGLLLGARIGAAIGRKGEVLAGLVIIAIGIAIVAGDGNWV